MDHTTTPTEEEKIVLGPRLDKTATLKRELIHGAFGILMGVVVALGLAIMNIEDFGRATLMGVAYTVVRALGYGLVQAFSRYAISKGE